MERRRLGRGGAALRVVDEFDAGFGWLDDEDRLRKTAHALVDDGRVWLVDAIDVDGVFERVHAAGEPAGVIQLLDRHARGCARVAAQLGIPHHVVPFAGVRGSPFEIVEVVSVPRWREAALWWPAHGVLVCADALGTVGYFRAKREPIGVHPLLRLTPPKRLARLGPRRVLVGHGEGVHTDAAAAVREAVRTSRRRLPSALAGAFRGA